MQIIQELNPYSLFYSAYLKRAKETTLFDAIRERLQRMKDDLKNVL